MKYFNTLIKPASSHCNMRCKYCFYHDISSKREIYSNDIMTIDVAYALIDNILNYFKEEVEITFAFQGGEPTLVGLDFYRYFVNYVNQKKNDYHFIHYSIQTNGILLNDEWIDLFKNHHFLVGISLDGFIENHNCVRVFDHNKPSYDIVMNHIKKLEENDISFNILTVLTSQLSKKPKELFDFYKKNSFKYVQLIPCLPEFGKMKNQYSLKPKEFFEFYQQLFPMWFHEVEKGNIIHFNHFDNLLLLFRRQYPYQCGYLGYCNMQFVIESDGSVYPCDFFCFDKYKIGNILENSISELAKSKILYHFLKEEKRISSLCQTCKFKGICNGNCKRQNICYFDDKYCALKEFMTLYERYFHYLGQVKKSA